MTEKTLPIVTYHCPECDAKWDPFANGPRHRPDCPQVQQTPVAYTAPPKP